MATSGDVTVAQDGGQGNVKLHPYLITLVRWCVSCLWSTANVLLHRLMVTPLQPITGPKPSPRDRGRRAPGTEHLHPEPRVECQLLHRPDTHTMDVIFVHGLYGSLGNTWRQGDWRQKYLSDPKIVTLRDHSKPNACKCHENSQKNIHNHIHNENKCDDTKIRENSYKKQMHNENKCDDTKIRENSFKNQCDSENITDFNDQEMSFKNINEKLSKKVIPEENDLITEQFYNNTLLDQVDIVENYDTQALFVRDMFKKETDCDKSCENTFKYNKKDIKHKRNQNNDNDHKRFCNENDTFTYNDNNGFKWNQDNDNHFKSNQNKCDDADNDFKCKFKINDINECKCGETKRCEEGCGCICNDCYSTCWPRDWIKVDFPGARVISINYTSDPYLWRPLWIRENKRLNLYQRAEQMIEQLLEMGVGDKPIIWVGHSKGGLFIKQIYCEAYEAYKKMNKNLETDDENKQVFSKEIEESSLETHNGITAQNIDTIIGHFSRKEQNNNCTKENDYTKADDNYTRENENFIRQNDKFTRESDNFTRESDNFTKESDNFTRGNDIYTRKNDSCQRNDNNAYAVNEMVENKNVFEQINDKNDNNDNLEFATVINNNFDVNKIETDGGSGKKLNDADLEKNLTSIIEAPGLPRRAALWRSSRGFMFYSVPHRGSPLALIKTPVTARSVDLLEIAKDCPLVLELQARWQRAARGGAPAVRSVVETCRTLMSVLWLRIVSEDSADAGVGCLSGVSVDHREVCKPASRACGLYTALTDLIHDATRDCVCRGH